MTAITGTVKVTCPACGLGHDVALVQSINTRTHPDAKARLLAGELNVLACDCGRRTQLAANVLFHDPDADYYAQVVPGGEDAMAKAAELFRAAGATGVQRLVPSLNALIEKVKILDAGLEDWAVEMAKVLLLASTPDQDLDRVMLFARVDRDAALLHWVLFDTRGTSPEGVASPLAAYDRLAARTGSRPPPGELRIDRAWAVEAVRGMIEAGN